MAVIVMSTEEHQLTKAEEIVKRLRPIDDTLFRKMFNENISLTQLVLRILLDKPDLIVENVYTQFDLKKLMGATKKGAENMCKAVEDYAGEKAEKAETRKAIDIALTLLKLGKLTKAEIGLSTKLPVDIIQKLSIDNNIAYIM